MQVKELVDFKQERIRALHYTWIAFFVSFFTWFNLAPIATTMVKNLSWLTPEDLKVLLICNVALTIPARVIIGALLDRVGPRIVFSGLLVVMSIPCFVFAMGDSFLVLVISRLVLSSIGAGFVVGVRMVSEWFPPKDIGFAEGFYAGWGNFGSAAAAMILPSVALNLFGGVNGWRYAIALTGFLCLAYGVFYYLKVTDTPEGKIFLGSRKTEPIEVSSYLDMISLMLWTFPLYGALALLTWKLQGSGFLDSVVFYVILGVLGGLYIRDLVRIAKHNVPLLKNDLIPEDDAYAFSSVTALNTTYFANFGAELAVISMLPAFFESTFSISPAMAGLVASSFALVNLIARPLGGFLSDAFSSRRKVMLIFLFGIFCGFFAMSRIESSWPLPIAIAVTIACSVFVQGAEGATFAIIPLVKKRMTGKVAGMVGAYGNVGAVVYLTVYTMVTPDQFFLIVAAGSLFSFLYCCVFLREPEGAFGDEFFLSSRDSAIITLHEREALENLLDEQIKAGKKPG